MKKPSFIIGKKQIILSCLTLMLAVAVYVNYAITKDDVETAPLSSADAKGTVSYGDTEFVNASSTDNSDSKEDKNSNNNEKNKENNKDDKKDSESNSKSDSEKTAEENADAKNISENSSDIPTEQAEGQTAEEYFAQARLERSVSRDESVATLQSIMGGGDRTDNEYITDAIAAVETSKLIKSESNILVVYYSAKTHTKAVAKKIAENINADIFEIVPEQIYTSEDLNWTNSNSRVSREHEDESLRNIKLVTTKVDNWEKYDTVLIGYPIWWGIAREI